MEMVMKILYVLTRLMEPSANQSSGVIGKPNLGLENFWGLCF